MSGNSRSLLLLMQRCVAVRQVALSAGIKTRSSVLTGRFIQQRSLSSLSPRAVCLQRLCELPSAVRNSQVSFCSKTGASCEDEYPPLPAYQSDPEPEQKEVYIVQLKGLPWSCSTQDILQFFSDCRIRDGEKGIHLTVDRSGRPTGRAFMEMEHEEDVRKALEKHRQYLGPRYVEVYEVTNKDAEEILKKVVRTPANDGVVRVRGLPFSCMEGDIEQFFSGLDILQNGITLVIDNRGRKTGEGYVQFASQEVANEALQRHKELIGNRYIEVFPSRSDEISAVRGKKKSAVTSQTVSQTSNRTGPPLHFVHARGLPFQVSVEEIIKFFSPFVVSKIQIECGRDGGFLGEADVYFGCHQEAMDAMSKNRQHIGERYIELFLNSEPDCDAR
ncbi:G-rich sequence factor 1 [Notolabrus celidotus]|uniref:G-rich sequence factor 1 n=1 Tax=Notolabrus celidotus TaxID=1203425 RepID=UPI00148FD2AF|nr:G-rich sequence factor 1 [Notolabrus celidotus]